MLAAMVLTCYAGLTLSSAGPQKIAITVDNDVAIVPVQINEQNRELRFVLDTGAEITTLDSQTAQDLDLPPGDEIDLLTVGEEHTIPTVRVNTLQVGPIRMGPFSVAKYSLVGSSRGLNSRIDGVLGIDVLSRFPFTIDYAQKQLILSESSRPIVGPKPIRVPLRKVEGGYLVPVVLNGTFHSELLLDTGTNLTQLTPWVWEQLLKSWHPPKTLCGLTSTGQVEATSCFARLKSLGFNRFRVEEPPVRVLTGQKSGVFAEANAPGLMGSDILRRFVVTVDFPHEQLLLAPNPEFKPEPYEYTTIGIQFQRIGSAYFVASVWEDSPAQRAGVRVGDEIVELQGHAAAGLSGSALHDLLHGPPASKVRLTLRRGDKVLAFNLKRRKLL